MNLPSRAEIILSKISEFYRVNSTDPIDTIKHAFQQLLHHWSEILAAADTASDDELFALNVSRAFLANLVTLLISNDCFTNDHSFTLQILRLCFDLLITYIDVFTTKNITPITMFLISNICLIMAILLNLFSLICHADIDFFQENEHQLFIAMREHIDQDFTHDNLTDGIISLIWNLSDNTLLVPLLLKADYAKSMIEWLKNHREKFREDKQDDLIYVLLNIARHDDAIDQLNALDALSVVAQTSTDLPMPLQRTMIHILLTDANHIELKSLENLNLLVQLTFDAGNDTKYRQDGSHVCEPLTTLAKLFYNDKILHHILCKTEIKSPLTSESMIEFFASLMKKFYPNLNSNNDPLQNFTCVLILNILLRISSHQEYRQIIYNNEQLMNIIRSAANNEKNFLETFMPRTMKNIQEAANETLDNLH